MGFIITGISSSGTSAVNDEAFTIWDATNGEHRLLIDKTGNVGLGVNNDPDAKLEINGQIKRITLWKSWNR